MEVLMNTPAQKTFNLTRYPYLDECGDDDVIIEVAYAGLNAIDLHIIEGTFPCSPDSLILGHEFSGLVWKIGQGVTHVAVGDRVTVNPHTWCKMCEFCNEGKVNCCQQGGFNEMTGVFKHGGFAEYCKVAAIQVFKLPPQLSLKQGCLCEPMSCLLHAWERLGPVKVGSSILVIGTGFMGILLSALLHYYGHRHVIFTDILESRRRAALKLGTGFEVLEPTELMKRYNEGYRANIAFDCSGNPEGIRQAVQVLKPTGTLCLFGAIAPTARLSIAPYEVYTKELTIVGTLLNPFSFQSAMNILAAMSERYLDPARLIIDEFKLREYQIAIDKLKRGEITKAVFKLKGFVPRIGIKKRQNKQCFFCCGSNDSVIQTIEEIETSDLTPEKNSS